MDTELMNKINISVSGWPGSGGSTLATLLACTLERQYLYIGNLYRYLGISLGFSDKGINRPQFDGYIEDIVGKTIDQYTDYKLLQDDNLVLDSDITAFRVGKHPKVFSIFLNTPFDERKERLKNNKLEMDFLDERDNVLKAKYQQLWGIDFFDNELINTKHNLVLNNANMGLKLEMKYVFEALKNWGPFSDLSNDDIEGLLSKSEEFINMFQEHGKQYLLDHLAKKGLFPRPEEILLDITSIFPEEISTYPDHIKNLFLPLNKK